MSDEPKREKRLGDDVEWPPPPPRKQAMETYCRGGVGHDDPDNAGQCILCRGITDEAPPTEPKRISEAELRSFEDATNHAASLTDPEDAPTIHMTARVIRELRRLRGLIVAATERRAGDLSMTMVTGWGAGETALMEEANAIREEADA